MKSKKLCSLLLIPVFTLLAVLVPALSDADAVSAANDFEITDGVLTNYTGSGGAVIIPSGKVTEIADQAFYGCSNITSLTIPSGVKKIGRQAFFNCSGMTSISVPASVTTVGELSFNGCSKLQNITVASGSGYFSSDGGVLFNQDKTTLLRYPEGKSSASYTVPETVTVIGRSAFSRCLSLRKVTLPSGLKQIRDSAFYENSGLNSLVIPASVTSIGSEAFRSASGLKTLMLESVSPSFGTDSFKNTGITRILYAGSGSQWGEADLSDIFGTSVKVYYGMSGFNVEDEVLVSFSGSASSVSVPGFIVKIDDRAFCDCNRVSSITLPTSLKYIGQSAFDGCTALEKITIPSSVISIGKWAFDNCSSLSKISVASDNGSFSASGGVLYDRNRTTLLRCPPALSGSGFTVPSSVTKIGDSAFSLCEGLENVVIPSCVEEIEAYAFDQCFALTEITIPASVKSVGKYAFRSDGSLATVTLEAISPSFGTGAFQNAGVSKVLYSGSTTQWNAAGLGDIFGSGVKVYCSSSDFEWEGSVLLSYKGSGSEVTIPDFVTEIGSGAFYGCTSVRSVVIPGSVKVIGESAFSGCSSLTSVSIPASVTTIGKWAFDDCTSLAAITVSSGNGVYSEADGVLYDKKKATLLRYPPNKSGSSFTVPSTVTKIADSAFASCHKLTDITLPSGVRTVEQYAFDQCTGLATVSLSPTVNSIGKYAFRANYRLRTVMILAKSPTVGANAFQGDSVVTVCFAGSAAQWTSAGLGGIFGSEAEVWCDYRYPSVTVSPKSVESVPGKSVTFSVEADGCGLTYQWYYKKAGQTSSSVWKNHTSATETVAPNATWNGIRLTCVVKDAAGFSVISSEATVTLAEPIIISSQPQSVTVEKGKSLTLAVKAAGEGLKYQWYYKKTGQTSFNVWNGRTRATETVTPNDTWNGIQLYCVVKDQYGNSLASDTATVTLREPLKITSQPQSRTVKKGSAVTLAVKATGDGLKYQWYYKKAGQTSFNVWNGRTHSSETVTPNDTWNGIKLYCIVTDSYGASLRSDAATICLGTPLAVTSQPQSSTVSLGSSITLSVKAAGDGLKYQWYYKKAGQTSFNVWNGRTHAAETVKPNDTWNGIQLYCVVTDGAGAWVKTNTVTVKLK